MKRLKKISVWTLGLLGLLIVALVIAVFVREDRTFDAPYPAIKASTDPAAIERGRYLAYGPAHCVDCHRDPSAPREGADPPPALSGGNVANLPVGTFYIPNITPDPETGIGRLRDEELARALRHGVAPNGQAVLPFMPFADLSDEDLTALLSFLRAEPPTRHAVPAHAPNFLGRAVRAFVLRPTGPSGPIPASVAKGPTPEYGRYLAHSVANCVGCHTKRDLKTGAFVGAPFAGGFEIDGFVTPNLTPDGETGRIAAWDEAAFVARFRAGRIYEKSPMPWGPFATMTEDDLRALYRYLRTVPAVHNAVPLPTGAAIVEKRASRE